LLDGGGTLDQSPKQSSIPRATRRGKTDPEIQLKRARRISAASMTRQDSELVCPRPDRARDPGHLAELYGTEVSPDLISRVTDVDLACDPDQQAGDFRVDQVSKAKLDAANTQPPFRFRVERVAAKPRQAGRALASAFSPAVVYRVGHTSAHTIPKNTPLFLDPEQDQRLSSHASTLSRTLNQFLGSKQKSR
jgi:hypothetical protein